MFLLLLIWGWNVEGIDSGPAYWGLHGVFGYVPHTGLFPTQDLQSMPHAFDMHHFPSLLVKLHPVILHVMALGLPRCCSETSRFQSWWFQTSHHSFSNHLPINVPKTISHWTKQFLSRRLSVLLDAASGLSHMHNATPKVHCWDGEIPCNEQSMFFMHLLVHEHFTNMSILYII